MAVASPPKTHGNMIKYIKRIILKIKVRNAIKEAQMLSNADGKRYLVIMYKGEPRVLAKQYLKKLLRMGKFKKGTTIQNIEKDAIIVTAPQKK